MNRLRAWITPPPGGDPRKTLLWVRRMEIVGGVANLGIAAATWSGEWWSWLLVAIGVLSLSPWPGVAVILRKAEKRPDVLISDPERRRQRGVRFLRYFVPVYVLVFTASGYLLEGVGGAIFFFVVGSIGAAAGVWGFSKTSKTRS